MIYNRCGVTVCMRLNCVNPTLPFSHICFFNKQLILSTKNSIWKIEVVQFSPARLFILLTGPREVCHRTSISTNRVNIWQLWNVSQKVFPLLIMRVVTGIFFPVKLCVHLDNIVYLPLDSLRLMKSISNWFIEYPAVSLFFFRSGLTRK
jgi:hypothetical protein